MTYLGYFQIFLELFDNGEKNCYCHHLDKSFIDRMLYVISILWWQQ